MWEFLLVAMNLTLLSLSSRATDTVISVEEDPEIEALSEQPLATPTGPAHHTGAHQQSHDHMHINLEQEHDIPGLVSSPEVCTISIWVIQLHNGV